MGALTQWVVTLASEIIPFVYFLPPVPPCLHLYVKDDLHPPIPLESIRSDDVVYGCASIEAG